MRAYKRCMKAINNASQLKDHCGGELFKKRLHILVLPWHSFFLSWNQVDLILGKSGQPFWVLKNKNWDIIWS